MLSLVWLFGTSWTVTCRAPLSMGFPRQEYWSGLPFLSPGHLPDPGIEPGSTELQADSLPSKPQGYLDQFSSVRFSRSVVSDSLPPHESQHARPPCPSPTPGVHPDPRPSRQWCHPAISSSVIPFSSCPQSLPASESFPMSQLLASGSQSTGVSALVWFPPKKSQDWSTSEWTGWISLHTLNTWRPFKSLL